MLSQFIQTRFGLIMFLMLMIILSGYGCSMLQPEPQVIIDPVTPLSSQHFIWLLINELNPAARFKDPLEESAALAVEKGYIPAGTDLLAPITRVEAAKILLQAKPPAESIDYLHFDWQIFDLYEAGQQYSSTLVTAYAHGLLTTNEGYIHPQEHILLADAQQLLVWLQEQVPPLPVGMPAPRFVYKGLVEIARLDPAICLDLKYATENNFTGKIHYDYPLCLLHEDVAERLCAASRYFQDKGYLIKIWDGYRPVAVQWSLHHATPDHLKAYVPAPSRYSQHAKGIAVDMTLADQDGHTIQMPTNFDDFSKKAHINDQSGSAAAIDNRDFLIDGMIKNGFTVNSMEWWHFYVAELTGLPVSDVELGEFIQARNEYYLSVIKSCNT